MEHSPTYIIYDSSQTSVNKFKKIKIIPAIFSNQNNMKLEINNNKARISTNKWKLKNTFLNNHQVKEQMKK